MFDVEVTEKGNLVIRASDEAILWIQEQQDNERTSDQILLDGLERFWTNGQYRSFDAGDANPFVGLTCAPCVAESMEFNDEGRAEIHGRLWYYPWYAVKDPMEELKTNAKVLFRLAH